MRLSAIPAVLFLSASINWAHEGDVARLGDHAPCVRCTTTDGIALSTNGLHGQVVLLIFFSLQSEPSMRELEFVERDLCSPVRPGLVTIVVGRDQGEKQLADLTAAKHRIFRIVADPKRQLYDQYATEDVPRTYVIGKDGVIKYASIGFDEWEIDRIKAAAEAALR